MQWRNDTTLPSRGRVGRMTGWGPKPVVLWSSTRFPLRPKTRHLRVKMSTALAGQAPLHRLHAAGIAAADDDTEIGARLPERLLVNVGLGGCILDDGRLLGATCELLAQEMQRALAALGWLREDRGRGFA